MSTLEIAELTGKNHKNVLADVRKMMETLRLQPAEFSARYRDAKGESRDCFNLPYRECMILVSGYSIELRARIVDRWMELEAKSAAAIR
jgi:phage regulator Rha-like protein